MSKGVLQFTGIKYDSRSQMDKPHFQKKGGGEWALDPGQVDFSKFQPGKLYVVWDNWVAQSATTEIPAGGGKGGFRPQPYHKETFVSNVVGQAIQAGCIKEPQDIHQWALEAWKTINVLTGEPVQPSRPSSVPSENPAPEGFDDKIPF